MPQPTNIGQIFLRVDGRDVETSVMDVLLDVLVEDDLRQPAMFVLRFQDQRFELIDGALFKLGAQVVIRAADAQGRPKKLLAGEVVSLETELEQQRTLFVVRGYDQSHRLHRGRKTRTFLKQTDADIVSRIAREAGLRAECDATPLQLEYVIQDNQTDMEFLRERAARLGFVVTVDERTLRFRRAEQSPPRAPAQEWAVTLQSLRTRQSAAAQAGKVEVRGWDPSAKRAVVGSAGSATQAGQLGRDAVGADAARAAFGGDATLVVTDRPVRSKDEADRLAQAVLDDLAGEYLYAEGVCVGEPDIRAGALLELKNVGARFSGTYFVSASRHEYTTGAGYLTTFFVNGRQPASLLAAAERGDRQHRIDGVVVGIVTNNNDPQKLGRVKVKFPWLDEGHESDWARLATPGAGKERGFFTLPEVDDEVLVAFEHGNISHPYVVGGLWNGKDAPPAEVVKGGQVQTRVLRTRVGHVIELQDDSSGGFIQLKTKGGNLLKISESDRSVTIESQGTVAIKGMGGELNISQSGVELTAKGTLKIQGQLVTIN
jgi:phage protein D/phage baseplate assembly protein gpV